MKVPVVPDATAALALPSCKGFASTTSAPILSGILRCLSMASAICLSLLLGLSTFSTECFTRDEDLNPKRVFKLNIPRTSSSRDLKDGIRLGETRGGLTGGCTTNFSEVREKYLKIGKKNLDGRKGGKNECLGNREIVAHGGNDKAREKPKPPTNKSERSGFPSGSITPHSMSEPRVGWGEERGGGEVRRRERKGRKKETEG